MRHRGWLLLVLVGLALGMAWLLGNGVVDDPTLRFRVDVGTLGLAMLGVLAMVLVIALAADEIYRRGLARARTTAVKQALADRRRFLQRLDHELKNPLMAIRAGLANAGENGEALASVDAQVRRISRLTADLRKLAELETRPLENMAVDLGDLLTQVMEFVQARPEAAERRLSLVLPQAPWPLPAISGDRDLLFLVVHNLVDNALKFSRPGDRIEVRASEDGHTVVVEIADTGPGIAAEDLPHIWEELYRGAGARGIPGNGLGLALVQAIVQRHNGQIGVRSRAGQGTVFTLRFPLVAG